MWLLCHWLPLSTNNAWMHQSLNDSPWESVCSHLPTVLTSVYHSTWPDFPLFLYFHTTSSILITMWKWCGWPNFPLFLYFPYIIINYEYNVKRTWVGIIATFNTFPTSPSHSILSLLAQAILKELPPRAINLCPFSQSRYFILSHSIAITYENI